MQPTEFISAATLWAPRQPDVRALAVAGSHAKGTAHSGSDIDLVLLCDAPHLRLARPEWLADFGPHSPPRHEDYGLVQALRCTYGAAEAEWGLTTPAWAAAPIDAPTARVIRDGLRALYDPERLLAGAVAWVQGQP